MADVNRAALGRAVWNLVDNAVKYSPDSRSVWVDVTQRNTEITIVVRDEGLGIPQAEQQAIFSRFVRGAESRRAASAVRASDSPSCARSSRRTAAASG